MATRSDALPRLGQRNHAAANSGCHGDSLFQPIFAVVPVCRCAAAADEATLLSHWEGLGYYRRARSMHSAAREIVDKHGGEFPTRYEDVIVLPGIGRYTAGAILSISKGQRLPVLEGNTQRVFSRWVAQRGTIGESATTKFLWEIAETMLPPTKPGTFNQAAMELGALICVPKNPSCNACPVRRLCRACRDDVQNQIPGKVSESPLRRADRVRTADRQRKQLSAPTIA